MKIRPVRAKFLVRTDSRTDRQIYQSNSHFRNFAKAPKILKISDLWCKILKCYLIGQSKYNNITVEGNIIYSGS